MNAENYLEKIFDTIQKLELEKDSTILVMSDHGISVGEKVGERAYGAFCYDYTLITFTYFLLPGISPIEITQQIRTIDFMPTILDFLELDLDSNYDSLDGESLMLLIEGKSLKEKFAFSETANPLDQKSPPKKPNTKSIRTSKWKLIFNEYDNTKELYDLQNDPNEKKNLINQNLEIENILWKELCFIIEKKAN